MDIKEEKQLISEKVKNLFKNLFSTYGYSLNDFFDSNIWFMNNKENNNKMQSVVDILSETPKENDNDVLKYILMKAYNKQSNSYLIKVKDFIDVISEYLINLNEELGRVEKLINKYDAYQTKNNIELNLKFYESQMKDSMKSTINMEIVNIENIPRGDYKISLLASFIHNTSNSNNSYKNVLDDYDERSIKEEILEYKMYQTVRVQDTLCKKFECGSEYSFTPVDFYSYESKNSSSKNVSSSNDSGTNILHFNLKFENLNGRYEEIFMSDNIPLLDIFLSQLKTLLENYKKISTFYTSCPIKIKKQEITCKLKLDIEFDPITISSIYSKITALLEKIIYFKVITDQKWKTIMNYFSPISKEIGLIFGIGKESVQKDNCLII